jgi:hypothetical protein
MEMAAAIQGAGGSIAQLSAFNLQVEEIQLTLANNNGQTVQLRAPQQNTEAAPGVQPVGQAKAAAA